MKWKKILVVYYSRSGETKKVAEDLARKLHGDLEEIKTAETYTGFIGYQRALYHSLFDIMPKVERIKKNLTDYDLILIGGPMWGGSMSAPVRSFLSKYKEKLKDVVFFCSQGAIFRRDNLFSQMQYVAGIIPWGTLSVSSRELNNGTYKKNSTGFVAKLQHGNLKPEKRITRKRHYTRAQAQH